MGAHDCKRTQEFSEETQMKTHRFVLLSLFILALGFTASRRAPSNASAK